MKAMVLYGHDQAGWYPRGLGTYADCLRALYPKYLQNAELLAGLSGNRREVRQIGESSAPLQTNATSWIYIPGFKLDDTPPVAILWEKCEDFSLTGSAEAATQSECPMAAIARCR